MKEVSGCAVRLQTTPSYVCNKLKVFVNVTRVIVSLRCMKGGLVSCRRGGVYTELRYCYSTYIFLEKNILISTYVQNIYLYCKYVIQYNVICVIQMFLID